MSEREIKVGDYIRHKDFPWLVGPVLKMGSIGRNKRHLIPGYVIRTPHGTEDFLAEDDAEYVGNPKEEGVDGY